MQNLIVYYGNDNKILKIVSKYKKSYNAELYEIQTTKKVGFLKKLMDSDVFIKRCPFDLLNYENIILISPLWFNKVPKPVVRFLEQNTGHIKHITYILYNKNKHDRQEEFDKMDKILNLRRDKSYYVSLDKQEIHVRVYNR